MKQASAGSSLVELPVVEASSTVAAASAVEQEPHDVAELLDTENATADCDIPACAYINLAKRTDRRAQTNAELARMGMSCDRQEAVLASASHPLLDVPANRASQDACRRSHLLALDRIEASGKPYGLVLEDDMMWQQQTRTYIQEMFCHIDKA